MRPKFLTFHNWKIVISHCVYYSGSLYIICFLTGKRLRSLFLSLCFTNEDIIQVHDKCHQLCEQLHNTWQFLLAPKWFLLAPTAALAVVVVQVTIIFFFHSLVFSFYILEVGGLRVTCSPQDPKFAGSNPAEDDGIFQDVKIQTISPPGGTLNSGSWVRFQTR